MQSGGSDEEPRPPQRPSRLGKCRNSNIATLVSKKIDQGNVRGAVQLLSSSDNIAEANLENAAILRQKHPARQYDMPPSPSAPECLTVQEKVVSSYVMSFTNGSSGGLDGLRPQHLKDMISCVPYGEQLLSTLTSFVNFVLGGGVPEEVRHVFFGANLIAFNKPDGGLRPIAAGNVLRRLVSKVAAAGVLNQVLPHLMPTQVGCGVPRGAEAAVHAARKYLNQMEGDKVMVKLDFKNAFNMIRRDCMVHEVSKNCPALLGYVFAAYDVQSLLRFGAHSIASSTGVQQGDPLGLLLFAMALQPSLNILNSEFKVAYLDDVTLAGPVETVVADIGLIIASSQAIGLELNMAKCEIIGNADHMRAVTNLYPDMQNVHRDNACLLGAALSAAATSPLLSMKVVELKRMCRQLVLLDPYYYFMFSYYLLSINVNS